MISVLTVNYESSDDVAGLAGSIARHPPGGGRPVELVVANNSTWDPPRLPAGLSVPTTVLDSPNRGYAAGLNLAFRHSRGDIVMIANPDVRATDGTFDGAVSYLAAYPEVGIVLPLLRYPTGEVQYSVRRFYTWPMVLYARSPFRLMNYRPRFFRHYLCEDIDRTAPTPVDWGLGAAMFLRRKDCDGERVCDERFFLYFEDVDLCYEMWRRGRPVMYCPQIECIHAHRRFSRNPFSLSGWRHLQSLTRFIAKYGRLPRRPEAGGVERSS